MRILVTGAGGMLGRDILRLEGDIVGLTHEELDILDPLTPLVGARPEWVINCAAFTNVDACETDASAFEVNAVGPGRLAEACRSVGARMLQVSTDYVFDGTAAEPHTEESPTNPANAYGRGKLAGERNALQAHPGGVWVVRTSWLFGKYGRCFPATMLRLASEGKPLRVVSDQVGCPTYTLDLAAGLLALITSDAAAGVYHLAGAGMASWHEFAEETLRIAGLTAEVTPIGSVDWPTPAPRPAFSALNCEKAAAFGVRLRDWREALEDYVMEAYHEASEDNAAPPPWRH